MGRGAGKGGDGSAGSEQAVEKEVREMEFLSLKQSSLDFSRGWPALLLKRKAVGRLGFSLWGVGDVLSGECFESFAAALTRPALCCHI